MLMFAWILLHFDAIYLVYRHNTSNNSSTVVYIMIEFVLNKIGSKHSYNGFKCDLKD